ncbi:MAG: alpha/beta hydrolase [Rhodospirillaceae bacterium]|nr:MAG: alpha/beta hydrolase [Rhodospirillaceae bacterium]
MANYVLVHGGAHGGWCWRRVVALLRAAGHDVYAPTLTGLGERAHLVSPGIDLDTHIQDVVGVLRYEDLYDVILVGHSYGGMVITGVADRALSRVGHLVYLDAAHPGDGQSLEMLTPEFMAEARAQGRIIDGVELVVFPDSDSVRHLGVTDPDDFAWMKDKLTPHPWKCFAQPLRLANEAAVSALPRTDINCSWRVKMIPPERLAVDARHSDRVWQIDSGHDLMITEPEQVVEMLLRLV